MKKKLIYIISGLLLILGSIIIVLLLNNKSEETDALKFKNEYVSLNNIYLSINVDENNPFIYKNINGIINMIDKKETFVLLVGDSTNNLNRALLSSIIKAANDLNIDTIYYVSMTNISMDSIDYEHLSEYLEENIKVPSLITISNGIIKDMTTGVDDNIKYEDLTDELINLSVDKYKKVLSLIKNNSCNEAC